MRHALDPLMLDPCGRELSAESDEELAELLREGNNDAFDVLVRRYRTRMVAYCGRILGSSTDAEDAAQEVFAAAFTSLQHRRGPTRFRLWLYRTAHNHCVSELRRRATRAPETILHTDSARWEPADQSPAPADRAAQREDVRRIFRDLRTLPSTQRTALVLREFESLSYEQVADELQTSVPSVKALLLRARATLAHSADDRERDRVTGFVPGVMGIFAGARETVARLVSGGALESLSVPGASPASALSKVALALAAVALTSSAAPVIQHRHPQRPGGTVETARPARAATAPAVTTLSVGHRHVDPVPAARSRPRRTRPPATAPQRPEVAVGQPIVTSPRERPGAPQPDGARRRPTASSDPGARGRPDPPTAPVAIPVQTEQLQGQPLPPAPEPPAPEAP